MKFVRPRAFRRRRHPFGWKRRWRLLLLDLLGREEPPERVAAAIALGIGIGFSPFVGLHVWIALGLAILFGLNKLDTVLGTLVGNVWTWPPVFHFGYRLGHWMLGYSRRRMPGLNWEPILHGDWTWILHPLETARIVFGPRAFFPHFLSFLLGTTTIAAAIGLGTYFVARSILALHHARHPKIAERAARRREALDRRRHAREAGGED